MGEDVSIDSMPHPKAVLFSLIKCVHTDYIYAFTGIKAQYLRIFEKQQKCVIIK